MHQDENHTRRKGREEKGEKIGCRSCSKSFARKRKPREGAPKKTSPKRWVFLHQDENHARRKGRKKEEEKQSRVVRARAAPDALPRGPHRGFGKNCLSPPYRNKSNTWVKDNPDEKYRQD